MVPILLVLIACNLCITAYSTCWISKLCSQRVGFYLPETNKSIVIVPVNTTLHESNTCILCGQISTSKHIDCKECLSLGSYCQVLLEYSGEHCGLHDISVQIFDASLDILPAVVTTQHYIISASNVNFYGYVNITNPPFGAILSNDLFIELAYKDRSPIQFQRSRDIQFDFKVISIISGTYPGNMNHLASANIEPGSWFYSVTPISTGVNGAAERGLPTPGYIEFVMQEEDIKRNRRYFDHRATHQSLYAVDAAIRTHNAVRADAENSSVGKVNICIWSSDNMDGQKRIWLQQIEHLDPAKFRFTWMLTFKGGRTLAEEKEKIKNNEDSSANTSLYPIVNRLFEQNRNGHVIDSPFNGMALDVEALTEDPGDGRRPVSETWVYDELNLYRYAHESLVLANYSIERIRPSWCQQFYLLLQHTLPQHKCSVLVYGNERGFSPDVLVTDAARILGIPTAAELLNLFVHKDVVPTVMVAPSTYAVEHESIQDILTMDVEPNLSIEAQRHPFAGQRPFAVVIPPSVDFATFNPARFADNRAQNSNVYQHPACKAVGYVYAPDDGPSAPCIVIAFIARLAPEKNAGLFLQAAYEVLQVNSLARFTIVGDGALRQSLENLADRLQIRWAVHFTGWVSTAELPQLLAGVDIVVNPSLRAWSETFCIANIEAMSMGVPLVTFAVGGIGEYVQDPAVPYDDQDNNNDSGSSAIIRRYNDPQGDFSVSSNAVVVNRANPVAVARAVAHLIVHPEVRRALSQRGRETVINHFGVQRQMQQYADLYSYLHTL